MTAAELVECEYLIAELQQKGKNQRYSPEELLGKLRQVLEAEIDRGLVCCRRENEGFWQLLNTQTFRSDAEKK